MAPFKDLTKQLTNKAGIKTRSQNAILKKEVLPKRKAEESPLKRLTVKRSTFNEPEAKENECVGAKSKAILAPSKLLRRPLGAKHPKDEPVAGLSKQTDKTGKEAVKKPVEKAASAIPVKNVLKVPPFKTHKENENLKPANKTVQSKAVTKEVKPVVRYGIVTRSSLKKTDESSDSSLYVSALEDLNLEDDKKKKNVKKLPPGVDDYDEEQKSEIPSVSPYAMDIFNYLKKREKFFKITNYMEQQKELSQAMRSLLVDWMVEIQENFELNHETLYLAVKLVDLYLTKVKIDKTDLQLVGCASLFVASKYDERTPPGLPDFVYVCDGLYKMEDILRMEKKILVSVDYQLGVPLSYRFLRRYARCAKLSMVILTLARYILEFTLMDYNLITQSDSKMACAALYLSLIMTKESNWTATLEYYTDYSLKLPKSSL